MILVILTATAISWLFPDGSHGDNISCFADNIALKFWHTINLRLQFVMDIMIHFFNATIKIRKNRHVIRSFTRSIHFVNELSLMITILSICLYLLLLLVYANFGCKVSPRKQTDLHTMYIAI